MSQTESNQLAATDNAQPNMEFAFGDAEPVLSNNLADYTEVFADYNGEYYLPPVSLRGLAQMLRANGHHESAIMFKRNMMLKWLKPNPLISRRDLRYLTLDWQVFGNLYLQRFTNRLGQVTRLQRLPTLNMRKRLDGSYCQIVNDRQLAMHENLVTYQPGEVIHITEADVNQDIYGVPSYLGGMQSVLLSEAATLFRRKYYVNGNHAGYILVTYDLPDEVNKDLAQKIKKGRVAGNFANYFIGANTKHGDRTNPKDKVNVIPIGELGQKDDYQRIKSVTLQEILIMHRIQPALAAMMPEGNGSFGDIVKISQINYENEVIPMQQVLLEINEHLPRRGWLAFDEPLFGQE